MRFILPRLETRTKEFMVDASSRVDKTREMRNESDNRCEIIFASGVLGLYY